MSSVSSILGNTIGLNDNSKATATAASNAPAEESVTAAKEQPNTTDSAGDSIELSDRAQKLQKLKEEFFPGGYRSIKITPAFIERLQEYGFLSKAEAEGLQPSADRASVNETDDKLEALSQFIERLEKQLAESDPENTLIAILNKADAILKGVDGEAEAVDRQEIQSVVAELSQYRKSDAVDILNKSDQEALYSLEMALRVADKVGQSSNASHQINNYLSILQFS